MGIKEELLFGDRILDSLGNVIIEHNVDPRLVRFPMEERSSDLGLRLFSGDVTPEEYAEILVNSITKIRKAYENNEELPEGAIVMHDPEREFRLWELNHQLLPLFTNHP